MHTTTLPHLIPPELAAYLSVIYFHQIRLDVEEELLDRFMLTEKSRLDEEKVSLLQVRALNFNRDPPVQVGNG